MNCDGRVRNIAVDDSVMEDKETLEDLITAAINNATEAREKRIQQETEKAMKELGLPADTKLPF